MRSYYNLQLRFKIGKYFVLLILVFFTPVLLSQNLQQQLRTADALVVNHHYNSALNIYKKIYQSDKRNLSAIIGVKKCLTGLQEYEELVNFLEDALKHQSQRSPLYVDLGEAYFINNNREKAFKVWYAHLERNNDDVGVYRLLAITMVRQRLYDEAIEVYLQAINKLKKQEALHVDIANLYKAQLNYQKASEHYLYYYLSRPKQIAYLQRQLLSLSDKGEDITPVVNALRAFLEMYPQKIEIREILAGLYLKDKQFDKAFDIYKSLENEKSNGTYIQKYARESFANNSYIHAINGYEFLIRNYQSSPLKQQSYYDLGRSYASLAYSLDNSQEAARVMEKAIKIFNDIISLKEYSVFVATAYIHLADIYLKFYFDLDNAIVYYQNFLKRNSDTKIQSRILIRLGDVYLTKGQVDEALKIYRMAIHKDFQNTADFKVAEVFFYSAQFKKAEKSYSQLLTKIKVNDSIMNNILARTLLIKSSQNDSLSLAIYARADLLQFQKKFALAAEEFRQLALTENSIRAQAGIQASKLYQELGEFEESRIILVRLKEDIPEDKDIDEIIFLLAETEGNLGNLNAALDLYHQVLTYYPNSLLIHEARERARMLNIKLNKEQI